MLNKALDWIRYTPTTCLLYTKTDVETWYARLRKVIDEKDNIFVVELNIENSRAGSQSLFGNGSRRTDENHFMVEAERVEAERCRAHARGLGAQVMNRPSSP